MNRFIVGIMLFKVRAMLCFGPLVWWWSLSPNNFNGDNANVWNVNGSNGNFGSLNVVNAGGVRPSIFLKSTTNVTGDGTSSSPFIINM